MLAELQCALQLKGRAEATVPATAGHDMCRFFVNLAGSVLVEDCKGVVTRESAPHRYLAARGYYAGYDTHIEGPLEELCRAGDLHFKTGSRRFDILFSKGSVKVSMQRLVRSSDFETTSTALAAPHVCHVRITCLHHKQQASKLYADSGGPYSLYYVSLVFAAFQQHLTRLSECQQVLVECKMGDKASMDDLGQVEEQMSRLKHYSRINHGLLIAFPKSGNSISWCRHTYSAGSYSSSRFLLSRSEQAQDDEYITQLYNEVEPFRKY